MENYELFNNSELFSWSDREKLIVQETYLFNKYILPLPKTSEILDIGTGNGRFLFALANEGFHKLMGIDLAGSLLAFGKRKALREHASLNFLIMDGMHLALKKNSFDVVLALQQIVSFISKAEFRIKALEEWFRALKPGGLLLSSFLHFEGRWFNPILSKIAYPIKMLKKDFDFMDYRYLPWLKLGGKINVKYLFKRQSYTYWFNLREILKILDIVGFQVIECVTSRMIREKKRDLINGGMLYIVAAKPNI